MESQNPLPEQDEKEHMVAASSDDDSLLEGVSLMRQKPWTRRTSWTRLLPWIVHCILLSTSISFILWRPTSVQKCPETRFPIVGAHAPVHTVRFHGNIEHASAFKGPPSKAVDEAWNKIAPLGVMSISRDVYKTLNASKYATQVPAKAGGGYMALFEGVHLIHCVRSLWEATYPDYYTAQHDMFLKQPGDWHAHLDHCADMLRQKLMCDADANLVTYNWIKDHYAPKPNFNVQHKCRDYDHLLDIAARQKVDGSHFANGWILRPLDRPVVEFEEAPFDPEADG